jgi:hypothetical protein
VGLLFSEGGNVALDRLFVTEGDFTEYAFEEAGQILKVDSKPLLGRTAGHL